MNAPIAQSPPKLPLADFLRVIECAPLVSIDLIVRNPVGQILLGLRNNEPAGGFWFVPGGCIRKNELMDQAFARITQAELGVTLQRGESRWLGVFEHFYPTNAGRIPGFGTHYVVLGHELTLTETQMALPMQDRHAEYRWAYPDEIVADQRVHFHSRQYFTE